MSFSTLQHSHRGVIAALTGVLQAADFGALSDEELLAVTRFGAEQHRLVDAVCARAAGEIARRSTPELGSTGLAQRTGHRAAQELVRVTTGTSIRDAATPVRVGILAADASSAAPAEPWFRSIGLALTAGTLSATALAAAAEHLRAEAVTLDVDRLAVLTRQVRDQIDEAGIADRENRRRTARSLRIVRQADGITRLVWVMDPETAATITDLYDRATSPRRGGPRFVSSTIERLACTGATQTITLDPTGTPLDVGREQRLYTRQQRTALSARDGRCMFPDCDRPASWCESHHITHWARDTGRTDLANGANRKSALV